MFNRVVVTGSLAYDHIMSMPGRFSDHIMPDKLHILNVSFIMKTFRREFGGTGGNIAYSLALLKIPTLLVATAGNDFGSYKKHLKGLSGLDTKGIEIYKNTQTAQGFVTTDRDDNQIWGFYEGTMKYAKNQNLYKILKKGDFVVVAPNDPIAMMKYAVQSAKSDTPYLFDPAFNITHFDLKNLKFAVKNCRILIGNDYEVELICRNLKTTKAVLTNDKQILITTLGSKGSEIKSTKTIRIPPAKPINTCDPTGAGDAYRAGFIAGYFRGLSPEVCGKMGSLCAVYTVEKYGTQTHKFTTKEFTKRYKANFREDLTI